MTEGSYLESVVNRSTTVKDAKNLAGLAASMEGERKLKQVVKGQLRHL